MDLFDSSIIFLVLTIKFVVLQGFANALLVLIDDNEATGCLRSLPV